MYNRLHERLKPLITLMKVFLPVARQRTLTALDAMHLTSKTNRDTYARCLRDTLRELLRQSDLHQYGWQVVDNSNCLHLSDLKSGLTVRFLKGFDQEGAIPPAGPNNARQHAWNQDELFDSSNDTDNTPQSLWGVELICTWVEDDERITCYIQQPISTGKWPSPAKSEIVTVLSHSFSNTDLNNVNFDSTESEACDTVEEEQLSIRINPQTQETQVRN